MSPSRKLNVYDQSYTLSLATRLMKATHQSIPTDKIRGLNHPGHFTTRPPSTRGTRTMFPSLNNPFLRVSPPSNAPRHYKAKQRPNEHVPCSLYPRETQQVTPRHQTGRQI